VFLKTNSGCVWLKAHRMHLDFQNLINMPNLRQCGMSNNEASLLVLGNIDKPLV
jgi:hypothetical protein